MILMFPYADYDFYVEKAHGKLEREQFEEEVLEASFFLRYLTFRKSDTVQPEELQYAACTIADMYAKEKQKADTGEAGKKSESTDGYSVTYISEQRDGETLEDLLSRKASQIARRYLAGTGLLNRKVGCGHDHQFRCDIVSQDPWEE